MIVLTSRVHLGPNPVAPGPVVHIAVQVEGPDLWPLGAEGKACTEALLRLLPGLAEHAAGKFPAQLQAPPGVLLGLVAGRVAVELQRCHRGPLHKVDLRRDRGARIDHIGFGYDDPEIGLLAGRTAVAIVTALLPAALRPKHELPAGFDAEQARDSFLQRAQVLGIDQSGAALAAEAARRGIPWFVLDRGRKMVQLGQGRHLRRIQETLTSSAPALSGLIQRDKQSTGQLLHRMHLPAPRQAAVDSVGAALAAARRIGLPVVVKPLDSKKGRGISLGVADEAALRAAFEHARRYSQTVLVESFIPGDDHRVLVVGGRIVAAAKRLPARVVGDGRHSVAELVEAANRDPRRGTGFTRLMNRIELDDQAAALLRRQGCTPESVPAAGKVVLLRGTANISTGGTAVDVTDSIHPDNRIMLERAARVLGLDVVGIDFITPDIARSFREVGGAICEMNASPGLRPHQVAALAPGAVQRDVVGPIIDLLFPGGSNGRIPIASITGTNGKTTTSRMLAHILKHAGAEIGVGTIGLATTSGVAIGDETVVKGDFSGFTGARVVLGDPAVDAAVLETARGGILKSGLSFDWCDVGAVLNVTDDHLGLNGATTLDALAAAKQCVAQAARRLAVLNADDPRCLEMAALKRPEQLCLFTQDPVTAALRERIAGGSLVIALEERGGAETVVLQRRSGSETLMAVADIPATLGGAARHNLANAMAAAGLALGLGLSPDGIAAALAAFKGDHEDNFGRLNIYDGYPFKVVFDFAHNPAGLQVLCDYLRRIPVAGRRIGVLSGFGYRHGHHIPEIAAIAAEQFDVFICSRRETLPDYTEVVRDFPLEEVPARLAAALLERGVPQEKILTIDLDTAAVDRGLAMAREGDLVVLMTGLVDWTWERMLRFAETQPS